MTFDALNDYLIEFGDTSLRVNRSATRRVIECAVLEWLDPPVNVELRKWRKSYARRVERLCKERFGMWEYLLLVVLGQLVSFVVKRLLEWWFQDQRGHGNEIWKFKRELEGSPATEWLSGDH